MKNPLFSLSASSGNIPNTSSVMASVGGCTKDVNSCHLDGRGSQISGPQLHRARKPDSGENGLTVLPLMCSRRVCVWSVANTCLLLFKQSLEEEEELQRTRASTGLAGAMMTRLRQSVRGVSWSFVLISTPLVIWIFSLDSDITNIFWEWWEKVKMVRLWGKHAEEKERKKEKLKRNWWNKIWRIGGWNV